MASPSKRLLLYALRHIHSPQPLPRLSAAPSRPFSSHLHPLCRHPHPKFPPYPPPSPAIPRIPIHRCISRCGPPTCRRLGTAAPVKAPPLPAGMAGSGLCGRLVTAKNMCSARLDKNALKSAASKPLAAAAGVVSKYKHAAGLQVEAFWKRNYLVLVGAGAVAVCIVLWRIMFGIASTFVGLSEGMAKYGFLALASAMVAFAGLYVRARFTLNPDKIYRIAMRKLNTSAGILEIMGAPLAGTDVRAYVMSGGGPKLKNFKLKLRGKRCFLIFPIRGSERRGLVSVEAKKKKGQVSSIFGTCLDVDIPMASGPDQRIFLIGDAEEYKVGGGLISELRDPIVTAMAAEKEFEELDQKEEEEDERRELEEEERKRLEDVEKHEKT